MATVTVQQDKKAIQRYHELLDEIKESAKVHAKKYVPKLCDMLRDAGMSKVEIRYKVMQDAGSIWAHATILDALPSYLKDPVKAKAGGQSGVVRSARTKSHVHEDATYWGVSIQFFNEDKQPIGLIKCRNAIVRYQTNGKKGDPIILGRLEIHNIVNELQLPKSDYQLTKGKNAGKRNNIRTTNVIA